MFDTRTNVGTVDAVLTKQLLGHPLDRGRAIHVQFRDPIRTLIPALKHQAAVVHAVVVVEMGEEGVRRVDRAMPALDQALMRSRPVVPHEEIVTHFDEVAGALTGQRWRRRPGPEQGDGQRSGGWFLRARWTLLVDCGREGRRRGQRRDEVSSLHGYTSVARLYRDGCAPRQLQPPRVQPGYATR